MIFYFEGYTFHILLFFGCKITNLFLISNPTTNLFFELRLCNRHFATLYPIVPISVLNKSSITLLSRRDIISVGICIPTRLKPHRGEIFPKNRCATFATSLLCDSLYLYALTIQPITLPPYALSEAFTNSIKAVGL